MVTLARALKQLTSGKPFELKNGLPKTAFAAAPARRLKEAKLLWVNWSYLRDLGVVVQATTITPEIEAAFLDAFAWAIPSNGADPNTFVGRGRPFYADRYGGDAIALNGGSGRAAGIGSIQIKGIGTTPLAHRDTDFEHRHGQLVLAEAIREAAWGELNHYEAPHGGNRVIAVIDTCSAIHLPDGRKRRTALLIRPFPVRLAHYMFNFLSTLDPDTFRAHQRTIVEVLPQPPKVSRREKTGGRRVRSGFFELADRLARQHAALMLNRAPHGALTASNIELSGQLLDYGTQSTQTGHGSTVTIRGSQYHSASHSYMLDNLRSLAFAVRLGLPRELGRAIPTNEELFARFKLAHGTALLQGLVRLCGFPQFLLRHEERTASYWKLAACLHALAFAKAPPVLIERRLPRWIGDYDLGSLLYCLACLHPRGMGAARKALLKGRKDEKLSAAIDAYFQFRAELSRHAAAKGVAIEELDELVVRLASVRNQRRPTLYLRSIHRKNSKVVRAYQESLRPDVVSNRIDSLVADNRRLFADTNAECVVREWTDRVTGARVRYAFVPRRGYAIDVRLVDRSGSFFGRSAPAKGKPNGGQPGAIVRSVDRRGRETTTRVDLETTREGLGFRLPLADDIVRVRIALAQRNGGAPATFELLPPNYFSGEREVTRHGRLAAPIRPRSVE